ncbi:hypothetical protein A2814_02105 [Candidatus Nomurabacteria bacterium RIFCSPHIGHO2_01_FULL_38_19]|uniref:Type 4a pilus biogenesis protein PilO n=1 Tax=Candidatus Nomurabacteria bacterium RIFCSPHIGHO2_01_FULL_38_19 TaxID=1801732 RepID=A0A1F6UUP1_9BACT|nr:MAG: hypothetical protein A2814_02105 [Candidatus Nomurabacteria bacterium RIFCSPHIGHO2_01_FULL_38_19]
MIRLIIPIILIGLAITGFFAFTSPLYKDISALKGEVSAYNDALSNSKALENERDKLTAKYNAISVEDLAKLQKLLPDNIDNIRLILEIEKIALPYGMVLKDVKYNASEKDTPKEVTAPPGTIQGGRTVSTLQKDYGVWDLGFSVSGTYNNFLNFTKDLENNLRIVDISSVSFSSDTDVRTNPSGVYKYDFNIKTYWLKN